jgi:hypothetical protein
MAPRISKQQKLVKSVDRLGVDLREDVQTMRYYTQKMDITNAVRVARRVRERADRVATLIEGYK